MIVDFSLNYIEWNLMYLILIVIILYELESIWFESHKLILAKVARGINGNWGPGFSSKQTCSYRLALKVW